MAMVLSIKPMIYLDLHSLPGLTILSLQPCFGYQAPTGIMAGYSVMIPRFFAILIWLMFCLTLAVRYSVSTMTGTATPFIACLMAWRYKKRVKRHTAIYTKEIVPIA